MNATTTRVLLIIEATTGGTRRHLRDLVFHLDRTRFNISVLCSTRRDPAFLAEVERMREAGIRVHIVPMVRSIRPLRDAVAFLRVLVHLLRNRYDIVHTHSSKAGALGRVAAWVARVPAILHTPHVFAFQMRTNPVTRRVYFAIEKALSAVTHRIICVSSEEMELALRSALCRADCLQRIANGIDMEVHDSPGDAAARRAQLGLNEDEKVVGLVGRLDVQKGHQYLVRAAREILQAVPRTRFLLIGDGPEKSNIQRMVAHFGLTERFVFLAPTHDVLPYYDVMDVCTMPSLWEGLPYTALETMAARRALVASRVGGMAEIIEDGVTGVLLPPGEIHGLARAVTGLLQDDARRVAMGEHARESIQTRYPLAVMIRSVQDLYAAALDEARVKG